ncbi:MAG: methyltransferase domain-containing protein [Actinomycetota bacterium]
MSPSQEPNPNLDAAYAVESPEDNRRLYRDWAGTYDEDFVAANDYIYHDRIAEIFVAELASSSMDLTAALVLDVGCGTGVVGEALRARGVELVDGIDLSPEMLAKAGEKSDDRGRTYRQLVEADLTTSISLADEVYGGVVSAGAFTHGHLGPDSLDELLRTAAPGARFALGINANHFVQHGFADRFNELAEAGRISGLRVEDAAIYEGATGQDLDHISRVAVFTRN